MRRSEINGVLRRGEEFIRSFGYALPPFAGLSPDDMGARRDALGTVIDRGLGWDVTDFGSGDFARTGLLLFTARNGVAAGSAARGLVYAEKIMVVREGQFTPTHRHERKAEDIINRGGGVLALRLFGAGPDGSVDQEGAVEVMTDGVTRVLRGGDVLRLRPGESVTLLPRLHWHAFWGEDGDVLVGEVSTVNDDVADNVFLEPVGRFASIEEDEAPFRLLVSDYAGLLRS
ncbi:D-lyxose/D-mannose family sugar isomerase [Lichenibacterium dinghuense]|uniref:D-lyxose/D-mannose family sugar isomerase n=1 Tax=Lichenibacterium dinghuense TaxID=2895977 RepID=UPI001F42483D|nr:D-lyxose/D-mannose family sugar isomerase [Lichenibacterium sp. 6Y81]